MSEKGFFSAILICLGLSVSAHADGFDYGDLMNHFDRAKANALAVIEAMENRSIGARFTVRAKQKIQAITSPGSFLKLSDQPLNNLEGYRPCAGYREDAVILYKTCWQNLTAEEKHILLTHELFGYAGLPDRDYRVSAFSVVLNDGIVPGRLNEVLNAEYSERINDTALLSSYNGTLASNDGGASGARGGGDPRELIAKIALIKAAIKIYATESAPVTNPGVTRKFWDLLLGLDVIYHFDTVGISMGARFISNDVLITGDSFLAPLQGYYPSFTGIPTSVVVELPDYLFTAGQGFTCKNDDIQGQYCEHVLKTILFIANQVERR